MQENTQEKSIVKQNILLYLKQRGVSEYKFYQDSGITRGILKQPNGIRENNIAKFLAYAPEVNPTWLLTGAGQMLNPEEAITFETSPAKASTQAHKHVIKPSSTLLFDTEYESLITKDTPGAIPLVSEKAAGGLINDENMNINERDVIGYYVIPKFRHLNVDFLIEVYGDSMVPFIYPGDIIACSIIHESRFIHWNKPHLIATHEQGMIVKRLRKSTETGCLLAVSDNAEYDPFDIPKNEIAGLARVVGVIHIE